MTKSEAVNWLINISADIGKAEHRDLWHYEQALYEIREMLESAQPEYIMNEWCTDCKEYDHEKHCCPRFNNVIRTALQDAQSEIIRCKDCKHRPTLDEDGEPDFPTCRCPCQCEDFYYSWMPKDDWFCGNAERREE